MTLTGSNSYTGLTTVAAGTLMVGSGGTLGSLPGNTLDNSALVFNHADNYTYAGAISGSGSVTQAGSGILIYLGSNRYSGGTTIGVPGGYPGSLQIGNGGAAGVLPGNTLDNGQLIFSRSDTYTYPGVISGSGAVLQSGNGTTVLTASNQYTGGTTINAGTLQLGDGTANNGSVPGDIADYGLLVFANPNSQTYAGTISGYGSLMKAGTGLLSLGGGNTFYGTTRIAAGVLQTANSAALQYSLLDMNAADTGTLDMGGNSVVVLGGLQGTRNLAIAPGATLNVGNYDYYYGSTVTAEFSAAVAHVREDRRLHADLYGLKHLYGHHRDRRRDADARRGHAQRLCGWEHR